MKKLVILITLLTMLIGTLPTYAEAARAAAQTKVGVALANDLTFDASIRTGQLVLGGEYAGHRKGSVLWVDASKEIQQIDALSIYAGVGIKHVIDGSRTIMSPALRVSAEMPLNDTVTLNGTARFALGDSPALRLGGSLDIKLNDRTDFRVIGSDDMGIGVGIRYRI